MNRWIRYGMEYTKIIPFKDTALEVTIHGWGHWEDESASTLRGYYHKKVWKCESIDFLPLSFNAEECQFLERYLKENEESIKAEMEEAHF